MSAAGSGRGAEEARGDAAEALHNEELERGVLGAMIARSASAEDVVAAGVTAEDFWSSPHRVVYDAIRALRDEGEHVDRHTLGERLRRDGRLDEVGTPEDLAALQRESSPPDAVRSHVRLLRDLGRRRAATQIGDRMRSEAKDGRMSGDEVVALAEGLLAELDPTDASGEPVAAEQAAVATLAAIQEAHDSDGRMLGVRTGIRDLDAILLGLRRGSLNILAARPSMGKSALALQIARSTAKGTAASGDEVGVPTLPALVFSLEMRTSSVWIRHLAAESKIDAERLGAGEVYDDEWTRLVTAVADLSEQPIYTDDSSDTTVAGIRAKARQLARRLGRQGTPLGVIVIDYVGLLRADGRHADRRLELASMSRDLKALAKELDVPVVLLAQLNRGCEQRNDKRPILSDLRESGDLEQDADTVTMIYRDEYYDPDTDEKGTAELLVRKNREGKTGTVRVTWMPRHQFFGDQARQEENAPRGRDSVPTFAPRRSASTS
ncbi:MAG: replicative DNA helicase [Actinomycetota bacterium]|nr:replicative DNA helicase [Actinomycetota bacterium]